MAQKKPSKKAKKPAGTGFLRTRPRLRKALKWIAGAVVGLGLLLAVLPVIYAIPPVHPVSTLMAWRTLSGNETKREWRDIEDISPALIQSVIMSEDGQFCSHHGVDWRELSAVIDDALDGEPSRGASTITMQLAKNLFLWQSRSVVRKVVELPLAVYLDLVLSKKRLMELYLNVVEWGPGIYGAQAAARHHFGVDADKLTRRQAAYLAVTLPNPILRNPAKPSSGLTRLARLIEGRARQSGAYVACTGAAGR